MDTGMGLLIWGVEDCFNVELDHGADGAANVGELYGFLLRALRGRRRARRCSSLTTFLALRDAVVQQSGVPKTEVTLDTKTARLFPWTTRRARWQALQDTLGWKLPDLEDPPGLLLLNAFAYPTMYFAVFIAVGAALHSHAPDLGDNVSMAITFLTPFIGVFLLAMVAHPLSKRLALRIPQACLTLRHVVLALEMLNGPEIKKRLAVTAGGTGAEDDCVSVRGASCAAPRAFFKLRKAFVDVAGIEKKDFTLDAELAHLLPRRSRRRQWHALAERLKWSLPPLRYAAWVIPFVIATGPALSIVLLSRALGLRWYESLKVYGFLFIGVYYAVAFWALKPLAVHFMPGYTTVRELVLAAVSLNYGRIAKTNGAPNPAEAWDALRHVVAVIIDVDAAKVTPETPLGCGAEEASAAS